MLSLLPVICLADADIIFKENSKAVVVILTYDNQGNAIGQGSGFIVKENGAIATNYHVISNAKNIKIKVGSEVFRVEGLLYIDKENDLVILKADGKDLPTVKIGDIAKANIGEKVYVIGSPEGLENTISDGILSGIREITPQMKVLQITAPISAGSSGGPVFNQHGEVIGIATFLIKDAQNLNFAMPINLIKDKITFNKIIASKEAEIEDFEKTADYRLILGYNFESAGLDGEAIEAFKEAIRIKPDFAEAHNSLGFSYGKLGMDKEAIEAYKQAIRIKPDYANAHFNLGVSYSKLGMNKEAIEAYKQAIRIKPDYAEVHFSLGLTYGMLGMNKEAIEAFKQAIWIKPDYAEMHFYLGANYAALGMKKEAIEGFKQAIRIKPDYAEAHYWLGVGYGELGMDKEAIEAYKQAIRNKPDYAEAHDNLGHTYGRLGMNKEAIEGFKQAIRIKPDYAEAHYHLGLGYIILNDRGAALAEYKILKDLDPEKANKLFNLIY